MDARRYLNDDRGRLNKKTGRRDLSVFGGSDIGKSGARKKKNKAESALRLWWQRVLVSLKLLVAGAVLGGLAWSMPVIWGWLDRPVARVEVGGMFRYLDSAQVQAQLQPYLQTTFFGLDLRAVQQQLQSDSWIDSAEVRKIWPDKVEIVLEEEVPIARWLEKELINAEGDVLSPRQGRDFSELPALGGPAESEEEVMQQYLTLSQQLRPLGLNVAGVTLAPSGNWSFQVDGVDVQLGGEELIVRMQRFSRLYFGQLKQQWAKVKSIDLRYRDGASVAWVQKPETTQK